MHRLNHSPFDQAIVFLNTFPLIYPVEGAIRLRLGISETNCVLNRKVIYPVDSTIDPSSGKLRPSDLEVAAHD